MLAYAGEDTDALLALYEAEIAEVMAGGAVLLAAYLLVCHLEDTHQQRSILMQTAELSVDLGQDHLQRQDSSLVTGNL